MKSRFYHLNRVHLLPVLFALILCGCLLHLVQSSYGAEKEGEAQNEAKTPVVGTTIPATPPDQPTVGIELDHYLDKTPVRQTKGLDLVKQEWTYDCMSCHRLLEAKWKYDRKMAEHEDIVLNHGNNRFCLNCHHEKNRNVFADYDGTEIAEEDVVLLCAKCHGPTYQDWKAGAHGRSNGYWDKKRGAQTRLRCIQCHDPHSPKFSKVTALAAPTYPERAAGSGEAHDEKNEDH